MSFTQAVVLAVVQGLTEFLPVSSSAHLVLVPYLMGWPEPSLPFAVALHAGTLLSLLAYFRRELSELAGAVLGRLGEGKAKAARRFIALLVIGTVPAALAGVLLKPVVEQAFSSPRITSVFLVLNGAALAGAEAIGARRIARANSLKRISPRQALVSGLGQAFAIFPGISRSGSTIAAAMAAGVERSPAATFSFFLAIPTIAGAVLVEAGAILSSPGIGRGGGLLPLAAAVLTSALVGYAAIDFFLTRVSRSGLAPYARYCLAAGLLALFASYLVLG